MHIESGKGYSIRSDTTGRIVCSCQGGRQRGECVHLEQLRKSFLVGLQQWNSRRWSKQ